MAHERLEHRELARGQGDRPAVHPRLARAQVERDPAYLEHGRLRRLARAQAHAHPREQLLEAERLRNVVVGPALEAGHLHVDLVAGGEHDRRERLSAGAQLSQEVEPIDVGQSEVEQHQLELVVAGEQPRRAPVRSCRRGEPVRPQPLLEEARKPPLVLDDEYPAHVGAASPAPEGMTMVKRDPALGRLLSSTRPP